jgi:hypothetical protein
VVPLTDKEPSEEETIEPLEREINKKIERILTKKKIFH